MISRKLHATAKLYRIRVYHYAICSNHLHLLIRGFTREEIQNFFRVFAGHVAQEILRKHALVKVTAETQSGCLKNQRKFWQLLIYSRILTWGREYKQVYRYVEQNLLEALHVIAYRMRPRAGVDPPV